MKKGVLRPLLVTKSPNVSTCDRTMNSTNSCLYASIAAPETSPFRGHAGPSTGAVRARTIASVRALVVIAIVCIGGTAAGRDLRRKAGGKAAAAAPPPD